jgi:hypothetical protein
MKRKHNKNFDNTLVPFVVASLMTPETLLKTSLFLLGAWISTATASHTYYHTQKRHEHSSRKETNYKKRYFRDNQHQELLYALQQAKTIQAAQRVNEVPFAVLVYTDQHEAFIAPQVTTRKPTDQQFFAQLTKTEALHLRFEFLKLLSKEPRESPYPQTFIDWLLWYFKKLEEITAPTP